MTHNLISKSEEKVTALEFADFVLEVGTYLLASGAHSGRVKSNIQRLADRWNFTINLFPTFKGMTITVTDKTDSQNAVTRYMSSPPHTVHLAVLTYISRLTWDVYLKKISFTETQKRFYSIKNKKSYDNRIVAFAIGLSCAGLCLFSGGDLINAGVALFAATTGFTLKVELGKRKVNAELAICAAAFLTTLLTGLGFLSDLGSNPEAAMATAVLYLIPGVPLINCVIDLIEGFLTSAVNRGLFAGFILLSIATGMTICITLLGINNF